MRIAILVTNTDESDFAQRHSKDGEKFTSLLHRARPDWACDVYMVKDGVFPTTLDDVDGVVITGSPASVHDDASWIPKLEGLIRDLHADRVPMFGACFGHQVIATALGGTVNDNPNGWVLGAVKTTVVADGREMSFYAAHKEQVTQMPQDAVVVAQTDGCPVAGFAVGDHILTTQYHPEMTKDFITALIVELHISLDKDIVERAESSLGIDVDTDSLAAWAAGFLERATARGSSS